MNTARIVAAGIALGAAGIVHAIEITDFPVDATSTVSREFVRAQAIAANAAKELRYDAGGPAVQPMSSRSRDEVRREAAWHRVRDETAAHDQAGGM